MNDQKEYISVIITTLNRSSLGSCLNSLREQTRPADEIIVMEDLDKNGGPFMRNRGIEKAKGQLLEVRLSLGFF